MSDIGPCPHCGRRHMPALVETSYLRCLKDRLAKAEIQNEQLKKRIEEYMEMVRAQKPST